MCKVQSYMVYVVPGTLDVCVIVKGHVYVRKHAPSFRKTNGIIYLRFTVT